VKIRLNKEEELDDGVYAAIESGRSMSRFIANTFRDFYSTELGKINAEIDSPHQMLP